MKKNKLKLNIQMFSGNTTTDENTYGVDKDYNKVEVYSKEETYSKEDFVFRILTGSLSLNSGETKDLNLDYPEGFTKDNCHILGFEWSESGGYKRNNSGYKGSTSDMEIYPTFLLKNTSIVCKFYNFRNSQDVYNIKILLIKIKEGD